ncbi:MAG: hypothetical protein RIB58_02140 [Phycisphaerales bacterium]
MKTCARHASTGTLPTASTTANTRHASAIFALNTLGRRFIAFPS